MCELTLEALGYRATEAAAARRIHDLTHTPEQRAIALRQILATKGDVCMIQQEIRHSADTFPRCSACGHEPRHIQATGSHSRETFDVRRPTGTRHQLECRCGAHTPYCDTLSLAENHWQSHFAVAAQSTSVRPIRRTHRGAL